jgi:hypothetical protein
MKTWLLPRLASLADAVLKLLADLTATRNIIALGTLYLIGRAFWRGVELAETSSDVTGLLNAMSNITLAAFAVWVGGKAMAKGQQTWESLTASAASLLAPQDRPPQEEPWRTQEPNGPLG